MLFAKKKDPEGNKRMKTVSVIEKKLPFGNGDK
jgi:hypothetical protein